MQCASVIDANTANRVCCMCHEAFACPRGFNVGASGQYCEDVCEASEVGVCDESKCTSEGNDCCAPAELGDQMACASGFTPKFLNQSCWGFSHATFTCCRSDWEASSLCKQLRAGCGVNLHDGMMGQGGCSSLGVLSGQCGACKKPYWCDDLLGTSSSEAWVNRFYYQGTGINQCAWKPNQRDTFVQTARDYLARWQQSPDYSMLTIENEVNIYVGLGAPGVEAALLDSLVGFFYSRTTGNLAQLAQIQQLQARFATLGKPLPIFAVTTERHQSLELWDPSLPLDLTAAPYNLDIIRLDKADADDYPIDQNSF